jgi:hypothetical protein
VPEHIKRNKRHRNYYISDNDKLKLQFKLNENNSEIIEIIKINIEVSVYHYQIYNNSYDVYFV